MTDRAFEPATANPFDQFNRDSPAYVPEHAAAAPETDNPFEQFNPYPGEKVSGFAQPKQPESSTLGAFGRGALRNAAPAIGGLAAAGTGAELGFAAGTAVGGPLAPITGPVGGLIGGGAAFFGGSAAVSAAQHWALSKLPDNWKDALGLDDAQERADNAAHPTASFLGGLAPYAVTMTPMGLAKQLPENATAFQRLMAHPATARVFGGTVMGGLELGQEAWHGESPDWTKVAISTGFGVIFNRPNRIGEAITHVGAAPVRALRPRPPVEAPAAEPAPAALPEMPQAIPEAAPAEAVPPPPKVTAEDWRQEITERTRKGQPNELPPTVAQANDMGIMGPGATEETFLGSHVRNPEATQAARETAQTEQDVIGPTPVQDLHSRARQLDFDSFQRRDKLVAQRDTLEAWLGERHDVAAEGAVTKAQEHLAAIEAELAEVQPNIAAAYRRAEDTVTRRPEPPEAATAEPAPPIAPIAPGAAEAAEPRFSIARDVEERLVAAGRPLEEARAHAAWSEAYWQNYASRFEGRKGTAEDIYRREAPEILGERASRLQRRSERAPRKVDEEKLSLTQFLAHRGGLAENGDLRAIFDRNPTVPGFGRLLRKGGMPLDRAREAAVEAGYLWDDPLRTGGGSTTPADLLRLLDQEAKGSKVFRVGREDLAAAKHDPDEVRAQYESHVTGQLEEAGVPTEMITPERLKRTIELMENGSETAEEAFDHVVMKEDLPEREHEDDLVPMFQRDRALEESHDEADGAPPIVNSKGFVLKLPHADKWGNPRFDPDDRARALNRLTDIAKMDVKKAAWGDIVKARQDIHEIIENLYFYREGFDPTAYPADEVRRYYHDRQLPNAKPGILAEGERIDTLDDFSRDGRAAVEHLLASRRKGILDLIRGGEIRDPDIKPSTKPEVPVDLSAPLPSGFHFASGRKLADVPDALFPQGGWAVINWLRQDGVKQSEINHFQLGEQLGNQKPVTREAFEKAIAERMFDFKRKTSILNPERSKSDYELGGTRAFTGPRIPGRGTYFERLMAFPKKLKGGAEMGAGSFQSPHWEDVHPGTWASWRGSVREVPGFGKMVVGEEGQSDFRQGVMSGRRPSMSEQEYLALKRERGQFEKITSDVADIVRKLWIDGAIGYERFNKLREPLSEAQRKGELSKERFDEIAAELRTAVGDGTADAKAKQDALDLIDKTAALRDANEKYFAPEARDRYLKTETKFTPEGPIDETYVRTMVRDLVMHALKDKADSIAISTSATTARIQNSEGAAHFYDAQLKPALERELRRLTGDGSIALDEVKLPKAMGAPAREKPYTVWAAKLPEEVVTGAREKGFPLFQRGDIKRGRIDLNPDFPHLITMLKGANASTFIHESAHDFLERIKRDAADELAPDSLKADAQATLDWLGIKSFDDLKTRHHEQFARGFEAYMMEGRAPSQGMANVFAKVRDWLISIYKQATALNVELTPQIRGVYDRLLGINPDSVVIAPHEPVRVPTLADIHRTDANLTEPDHAEPVGDLASSEFGRTTENLVPDVEAEFRAAEQAAADKAAESAVAGSTAPAEAGNGAGRTREVGAAGGDDGGVAPGAGGGAANGDLDGGHNEAVPEGAGPPENSASARTDNAGQAAGAHPLAASPSDVLRPVPFNVGKSGNVRVENITSVPDLVQAIEESSQRIGGGGRLTMGDMLGLADDLAINAADVSETHLARMFGGIQNLSSKIYALRTAIRDSAQIVTDAMAKAAKSGRDADLAEMAVAMARHDMMQSVLSSVTTETGRGLGMSFKNLEGWEKAENLKDFLQANTGRTLFQLQRMAKLGANLDSPAKVSKFLRDAQKRSFGKMILEYWINGLISGPTTHATYAIGNQVLSFWKAVPETLAAAAVGQAKAAAGFKGERVRFGESLAGPAAMFRGLPASVQAAIEAARTGQTTLLPGETAHPLMPFQGDTSLVTARTIDKPEAVTWREAGADAFALMRSIKDSFIAGSNLITSGGVGGAPTIGWSYSPLGAIPDIAIRGVPVVPLGSAIRLPGRGVAAIHSFFRTMNYLREGAAEAYRVASADPTITTSQAFAAKVADVRTRPSEEQMERWRHGATELALMGQGGKFVQAMSQLTNATVSLPILGEIAPLKFIDPFVHIGANVIKQAVVLRTPAGILSSEIRADLMGKNGAVAQDMASGRMLAGTATSLLFGTLAMEGFATGSGPKEPDKSAMWRLAGYQPHSVRIGDMWYDVHRLGPMGMLMGIAADLYDVAHEAEKGDMLTAASHLQHAVTQNILDESFMRGPADLIKAIEDPGRYGEAYLRNMISSFVPFSVGLAQMARAGDPYSREARTVVDAIKAKVPGLSETLFPRRDIWGEEMPSLEALGMKGLTAIYMKKISEDPVNIAMLDLGISPAKLGRKIRNIDLTDAQYDDFARTAGRMVKMRLDTIVRLPEFRTWANHVKHDVLKGVIEQTRESARGFIMTKYPQIPHDASIALRKSKTGEP